MADIAKELVIKINHMQEKGEAGPLADLLASLAEHEFSTDQLANSGLSKMVSKLRKHGDQRVSEAALDSVNRWKAMFAGGGQKPADAAPAKPGAAASAQKREAGSKPQGGAGPSVSSIPASAPDGMARTAALTKLAEVFGRVIGSFEDYKLSADEVDGVNPMAVAGEIEGCMHAKLGAGSGVNYKNKLRSLLFNLKDQKNTDLVCSVICGSITPEKLVTMDPKDMASTETKKWREQVAEYKKMELMDNMSYQRYAFAGRELPDGLFECPKCRSKKTQYSEKQTRSADEPTTKFCHCSSCDYRWKFC
ncbi:transcription factor S-II, central domain-containing protein [Pavlovales sp. CCMP2436]|nr:transcription factor S-II, central domain-containing protein [Pavlovales sp. CCMP2436]|mmetsp:Transcript_31318/g.78348  ORF Transcript_31318/g.78348 Transcript_31318/m.78348 type:complete len:306 (-) Transcript_31318:125-1042(-)